jgi:outer membrane receptor protein involved in Fe transport
VSWGRSRTEGINTSPIYNNLTLDADIRSGALDIFRDLNLYPPDYIGNDYLLDSPNNFTGPFVNTQTGGSLRLAGPTVQLPGGPLALSAFYEHRKEAADRGFSRSVFLDFDFDTFEDFYSEQRLYYAARAQQADSLSLELNAPFVARGGPRRFVYSLDGQFSVRHDEYRTNGVATAAVTLLPGDPIPEVARSIAELSSSDYTVGLRYAPSADLAVRVSYGTGFLPPSVAQITPNVRTGATVLRDPKREGVSVVMQNVTTIDGGNPDLEPEESTSLSVGLALTPRLLPGLRLSLDYTEIDKEAEISFVSSATLLADETQYPGRVVRAGLTDQDIEDGYEAGRITSIDLSMINLARSVVRNLDIQLDYRFETAYGALRAYALATYAPDYITQFQPDGPRYNNAGHTTSRLQWRGNAGLTLERELFSLDWNMQYFDSYLLYPASATPATIPSYTVEQGSDTIPSQMYHDVVGRVRLGDMFSGRGGFLADTELQIGIRNVFNTSPPILATSFPSGGYSFFGDPRLRRYSIVVRKQFR